MNEELELPKPFCVVRLDRIGGAADVAEDAQDAEMWVHGCEDVYTAEQVRELVRAAKEQERERLLFESDPFCPKCGHNRDKSSVSSIDEGDGRRSCQMCGTVWREVPG